jgi:hypothetical protein
LETEEKRLKRIGIKTGFSKIKGLLGIVLIPCFQDSGAGCPARDWSLLLAYIEVR